MVKVDTGVLATLELRELITVTGSGGQSWALIIRK
jgi:hypothetical protein